MRRALRALAAALVVTAGTAVAVAVAQDAHADTTICDPVGSTVIGNRYVVMNNRWGSSGPHCINATANGFTITTQANSSATNGAPVSYPAIYLGCHYGNCSPNSGLPRQVSQISTAPSSITYHYVSGGAYDAAYDIWLDPSPRTTGNNAMEVMIWLNRQGPIAPIGGSPQATVAIAGHTWSVWRGSNGSNNVISYTLASPIPSLNFDVKDFLADVRNRGAITDAWYLTSIQAGFEPWNGGVGLAVTSFFAGINTSGPTTPPTTPPVNTGAIRGFGGKCVDVAGANPADGTPVQLFTCNGTGAQTWTRQGATLQALGKCLDVTAAGTANGTPVQLYTCNGTAAQSWNQGANGSLVNSGSGKCLDATGNSSADGTRLQIWSCGGSANQSWTLS